jgi:hypothetical protein
VYVVLNPGSVGNDTDRYRVVKWELWNDFAQGTRKRLPDVGNFTSRVAAHNHMDDMNEAVSGKKR